MDIRLDSTTLACLAVGAAGVLLGCMVWLGARDVSATAGTLGPDPQCPPPAARGAIGAPSLTVPRELRAVAVAAAADDLEVRPTQTAASDEAVEIVFRGRVLGRDGKPLAGAEVRGATSTSEVSVSSGPDGAYELTLAWRRGSRRADVVALMPGMRPGFSQYEPAPGELGQLVVERDLRLSPGKSLKGRVVHHGAAVAGAIVDWGKGRLSWSNARGEFFVSLPADAVTGNLHVGHGSYGSALVPVKVTDGIDIGDVELLHTGYVCGRVVFADGQEASGIELTLCAERSSDGVGGVLKYWGTTTDEFGRFEAYGLAPIDRAVRLEGCLDPLGRTMQVSLDSGEPALVLPGVVASLVMDPADARGGDCLEIDWQPLNAVAEAWSKAAIGNPRRRIVPFGSSWRIVARSGQWVGTQTLEVPEKSMAVNAIGVQLLWSEEPRGI